MRQFSSGLVYFCPQLPSQSALRAASSPKGKAKDNFFDTLKRLFHWNRRFFLSVLHKLYDPAGTQTGCTEGEEFLRIRHAGDAAGGFDLHMGGHMAGK